MALFHCNFYSKYLGYDTQVNVILPENRDPYLFDEDRDYYFQAIYLLHGLGDDCNGWMRKSSIERYALEHQLAVIMPSGEDSFYLDTATGKNYFSYMTKELPKKMGKLFPISDKPEDTFLAGLSMGGYGALKIGLTFPEKFGGIGIFSAATCPDALLSEDDSFETRNLNSSVLAAFGTGTFSDDDLPLVLLNRCIKEHKTVPQFIHYEGKQDFLYEMNQLFRKKAESLLPDYHYDEWDGIHDWTFWDKAIETALNTFHLKNRVLYRD